MLDLAQVILQLDLTRAIIATLLLLAGGLFALTARAVIFPSSAREVEDE